MTGEGEKRDKERCFFMLLSIVCVVVVLFDHVHQESPKCTWVLRSHRAESLHLHSFTKNLTRTGPKYGVKRFMAMTLDQGIIIIIIIAFVLFEYYLTYI